MAQGVFTVRIPPEKQRQLDTVAQALDRSRNWVVSAAIDQYLDV
jgi:predicted transcriptional regulator